MLEHVHRSNHTMSSINGPSATVISLLMFVSFVVAQSQAPGGLSQEQTATPHVKEIVATLKTEINNKIYENCVTINNGETSECTQCKTFEALRYRSQVVAGTNYFVKVMASDDCNQAGVTFYVVKIFEQKWTHTLQVMESRGPEDETTAI